jgi:hypothetical protein
MRPTSLEELRKALADLSDPIDRESGGMDTNLWIDDKGVLRSFSFEGRTIDGILQGVIRPESGVLGPSPEEGRAKVAAEVAKGPFLPCPFCGGEPILNFTPHGDEFAFFLRCRSCATEGPWSKVAGGARRMWEMRTAPEAVGDPEGWIPIEQMPADVDGDFELVSKGPAWPILTRVYVGPKQPLGPMWAYGVSPTHYRPAPKGPRDWCGKNETLDGKRT